MVPAPRLERGPSRFVGRRSNNVELRGDREGCGPPGSAGVAGDAGGVPEGRIEITTAGPAVRPGSETRRRFRSRYPQSVDRQTSAIQRRPDTG